MSELNTLSIGESFESSLIEPSSKAVELTGLQEAFFAVILISVAAKSLNLFPGHEDSKFWPVFIPEHYGRRNSQHLLDPYSFVHFGHGILSFYLFDDPREEDAEFLVNRALIKTLFAALAFEMIENTEMLIDLFRENSGTSSKSLENKC